MRDKAYCLRLPKTLCSRGTSGRHFAPLPRSAPFLGGFSFFVSQDLFKAAVGLLESFRAALIEAKDSFEYLEDFFKH